MTINVLYSPHQEGIYFVIVVAAVARKNESIEQRKSAMPHGSAEMDNEHYILTGPFKVDDKSGNYVNIFNVL